MIILNENNRLIFLFIQINDKKIPDLWVHLQNYPIPRVVPFPFDEFYLDILKWVE